MSPLSDTHSRQRTIWRLLITFTAVLAASSLLVSVSLFSRIQQSRHDTFVLTCQDTNARYHNAITALNVLIQRAHPPLSAKRRKQAKASNEFLLSRVLPVHRDCGAYADRLLSAGHR